MDPFDPTPLKDALHQPLIEHWKEEDERYQKLLDQLPSRFETATSLDGGDLTRVRGDVVLDEVQELFYHGIGVKWSEVQIRIFNAFVDSLLPLIYGEEWDEAKARVMRDRGLTRIQQEVLVNMARRNGKTYVTAGTCTALFLKVPGMSCAIFATGERTARKLMEVVVEMIERAMQRGTHVRADEYQLLQKNKEMLVYQHPSGEKQVLGCYPGSVRVSHVHVLSNQLSAAQLCYARSTPHPFPFAPPSAARCGMSTLEARSSGCFGVVPPLPT